jgi:hypothetical protein
MFVGSLSPQTEQTGLRDDVDMRNLQARKRMVGPACRAEPICSENVIFPVLNP